MCPLRYLTWGGEQISHIIHLIQFLSIPLNFLTRVKRDFPRGFPFPKRGNRLKKGQFLALISTLSNSETGGESTLEVLGL